MANSSSTQDLIKGVLQKCGEVLDGNSAFHELALKYINQAYHEIISGANEFIGPTGHSWRWARSRGIFQIVPFFSTGTVSLSSGTKNGVFSDIPNDSAAGYILKIDNEPTYYEIATNTASTAAFTLRSNYLGETSSQKSYKAIPLRYDLVAASGLSRGILRLLNPLKIYENRDLEFLESGSDQGRIYGLDWDSFVEAWPLRDLQNGTPSRFATDTRSDTTWVIQFNKYPTNTMQVDFDYVGLQDDLVDSSDDIPLLPREYRNSLECAAAHYLLVDKEEKEKAGYYFNLAKVKLQALHDADFQVDNETGRSFGKLIPRMDETGLPWWLIGR